MPTKVPCPRCGRPVPWTAESKYRPFCSERCRLIDLGAWFDESHRIPGAAEAPDEEAAPESEDRQVH